MTRIREEEEVEDVSASGDYSVYCQEHVSPLQQWSMCFSAEFHHVVVVDILERRVSDGGPQFSDSW